MFGRCSCVNVKPTDTESVIEEISESSNNIMIISNRIPGDKSNETKTEVRNIMKKGRKIPFCFLCYSKVEIDVSVVFLVWKVKCPLKYQVAKKHPLMLSHGPLELQEERV